VCIDKPDSISNDTICVDRSTLPVGVVSGVVRRVS